MKWDKEILAVTHHRQYNLPKEPWVHFQHWHKSIMLHWNVSSELLLQYIPKGVQLDLFNGEAYISLFAFSVIGLRPRYLPPLPYISNFHEINLRTYVIRDGKPGIYFLSIEAQKIIPAALARFILGLPYKKSHITRKKGMYKGIGKNTKLNIEYTAGNDILIKDKLDTWLTERHCLYEETANGKLFRIDIHHKPWNLKSVTVDIDSLDYPFCNSKPDLVHYNESIDVLVWGRTFL